MSSVSHVLATAIKYAVAPPACKRVTSPARRLVGHVPTRHALGYAAAKPKFVMAKLMIELECSLLGYKW